MLGTQLREGERERGECEREGLKLCESCLIGFNILKRGLLQAKTALPGATEAHARSCHVLGQAQHKLGRQDEAIASWQRGILVITQALARPQPQSPLAKSGLQLLMGTPAESESDDEATPRLLAVCVQAVSVGCALAATAAVHQGAED